MDIQILGNTLLMSVMLFGSACATTEPRDARCPAVATAETTAAGAESSKALVKRYLDDLWIRKDVESVPKYVAADLVNHAAIAEAQGAAGMQGIARKLYKAFPDLKTTLLSLAADDDIVIARVSVEGTHLATLDFKRPLEATNKHMKIEQVHTFRVKEGRIVEAWMVMDKLDLLTQLGAMPAAVGRAAPAAP